MTPEDLKAWMIKHNYTKSALAAEGVIGRSHLDRFLKGIHPIPKSFEYALKGLECSLKHK